MKKTPSEPRPEPLDCNGVVIGIGDIITLTEYGSEFNSLVLSIEYNWLDIHKEWWHGFQVMHLDTMEKVRWSPTVDNRKVVSKASDS